VFVTFQNHYVHENPTKLSDKHITEDTADKLTEIPLLLNKLYGLGRREQHWSNQRALQSW